MFFISNVGLTHNLFYTKVMRVEQSERIEILKQSSLFGYLTPESLTDWRVYSSRQLLLKGEIIFEEGEPSEMLFFIFEGEVDLTAIHKREETLFTTLHRGDFFGEESLFEDDPRYYAALAATDVVLLTLDVESYLYIYPDLPDFEERLEIAVDSRKLAARMPFPGWEMMNILWLSPGGTRPSSGQKRSRPLSLAWLHRGLVSHIRPFGCLIGPMAG